jgi:hypothetical protein
MGKKDRIAIVVSILCLLFSLFLLGDGTSEASSIALTLFVLLLVYWSYRFLNSTNNCNTRP